MGMRPMVQSACSPLSTTCRSSISVLGPKSLMVRSGCTLVIVKLSIMILITVTNRGSSGWFNQDEPLHQHMGVSKKARHIPGMFHLRGITLGSWSILGLPYLFKQTIMEPGSSPHHDGFLTVTDIGYIDSLFTIQFDGNITLTTGLWRCPKIGAPHVQALTCTGQFQEHHWYHCSNDRFHPIRWMKQIPSGNWT